MTDNDWIKQLQSKMEHHQEPVPDDLWLDIEAQLPERHTPRHPMVAWRRVAAAAAAALVIACGSYMLWQAPKQTVEQTVGQPSIASTGVGSPVIEEAPSPAGAVHVASVPTQPSSRAAATHTRPIHQIEPFTPAETPEPKQSQSEQQDKVEQQTEPQRSQPTITPSHEDEPLLANNEGDEGHQSRTPKPLQHRRLPVTMGLYAANGYSIDKLGNNDFSALVFADEALNFGSNAPTEPNTYYPDDIYYATHHAPYSLGLSVKFPLNNHWAVTSGVVYTRVKSDFSSVRHSRVQTLHYIGVPLGVTYKIWNYKRLGIYAIGGMQADFNVKATLKQTDNAKKLSIGKDRVQFSALLGPGVQLDLARGIGIYIEPTAHYYLDNGSSLQNYFKDKPFNINLNAGLRLTLQ